MVHLPDCVSIELSYRDALNPSRPTPPSLTPDLSPGGERRLEFPFSLGEKGQGGYERGNL
jgi:hypothetical protein